MIYSKTLVVSFLSLLLTVEAAPPGGHGRGPDGGSRAPSRPEQHREAPRIEHHAEQPRAPQARHVDSVSRTPSLSRSDVHPSAKEKAPQKSSFSRDQMKQYVQQSKQHVNSTPPTKQKQQEAKTSFQERHQSHQQAVNHVKEQIDHNHPHHPDWFNEHFFESHHYHPNYYHSGVNGWYAPQWNNITVFLGGTWGAPLYYGGDGYPVEVSPDMQIAPPQTPYQQQQQDDWMPLGVFAAGKDGDQAAYTNMFVQLALNKDGDLAGTYYNATSDQTHPLEGYVDRDTQLAIWKVADQPNSPTMMTGLYNLSQDTADVQVRFTDDTVQNWVFVRINQ